MEYLAYSHMVLADMEANVYTEFNLPEIKLKFSLKKYFKSAWLTFASIGALTAIIAQTQMASATYYGPGYRYYVNTNGSCLNVRTGPSSYYSSVQCYSNGARLPRVIGYRNGFAQLTNGYYVAATWISGRPGSGYYPGSGVGGEVYLSIGDRGHRVARLQSRLGISITRYYDYRTYYAVKRYQRRVGLTPDGVAGPATLYSLFS